MIQGIVPASTNDLSCGHTEHRLKPQICIVAIVPIIAVHTAFAGANADTCPFLSVVTHKDAIIGIPRLVMIYKGNSAIKNRFTAIVWTMHEGGRILGITTLCGVQIYLPGCSICRDPYSYNVQQGYYQASNESKLLSMPHGCSYPLQFSNSSHGNYTCQRRSERYHRRLHIWSYDTHRPVAWHAT